MGRGYVCKGCKSLRRKAHYSRNKETINAQNKNWYANNKERRRAACRKWETSNNKAYRSIANRWASKRKKSDPDFVFKLRMRAITSRLKKRLTCKKSTLQILGCTYDEARIMLGERPTPDHVIDHICPLAQAQNTGELIRLGHVTNLRWLGGDENYRKLDRPTTEAIEKCRELLGREWIVSNPNL